MAVAGIGDADMQELQQALAALAAGKASREGAAAGGDGGGGGMNGVGSNSLNPSVTGKEQGTSAVGFGFEGGREVGSKRASALSAFIRDFQRDPSDPWLHLWGSVTPGDHTMPPGFNSSSSSSSGGGVEGFEHWVLEGFARDIASKESHAERSLMHRYNTAADIVQGLPRPQQQQEVVSGQALAGLVAVGIWLRFSAARYLRWNHNYNIKPREISAALDRLGQVLVEVSARVQGLIEFLGSNKGLSTGWRVRAVMVCAFAGLQEWFSICRRFRAGKEGSGIVVG
jgi:hypothetical protein